MAGDATRKVETLVPPLDPSLPTHIAQVRLPDGRRLQVPVNVGVHSVGSIRALIVQACPEAAAREWTFGVMSGSGAGKWTEIDDSDLVSAHRSNVLICKWC